jgi:hypothetical protein
LRHSDVGHNDMKGRLQHAIEGLRRVRKYLHLMAVPAENTADIFQGQGFIIYNSQPQGIHLFDLAQQGSSLNITDLLC